MAGRCGKSGTHCIAREKSNALISGSGHWLTGTSTMKENKTSKTVKENQLGVIKKDFVLILQLKKRS